MENAAFNGTNLINGTVSGITALASADGVNKITVDAEDMNLSGAILTMSTTGHDLDPGDAPRR